MYDLLYSKLERRIFLRNYINDHFSLTSSVKVLILTCILSLALEWLLRLEARLDFDSALDPNLRRRTGVALSLAGSHRLISEVVDELRFALTPVPSPLTSESDPDEAFEPVFVFEARLCLRRSVAASIRQPVGDVDIKVDCVMHVPLLVAAVNERDMLVGSCTAVVIAVCGISVTLQGLSLERRFLPLRRLTTLDGASESVGVVAAATVASVSTEPAFRVVVDFSRSSASPPVSFSLSEDDDDDDDELLSFVSSPLASHESCSVLSRLLSGWSWSSAASSSVIFCSAARTSQLCNHS